jgi:DNA-binding transcriptional MerR regulator
MKRPTIAKAPDALRSIGEVVDDTGIPAHVLRYWEANVPALQPLRRAGGRRYFRPADVALVRQLKQLTEDEGYTLDGAARALRRGEVSALVAPAQALQPSIAAVPAASVATAPNSFPIASLTAVRDRLRAALASS